MRDFLKDIFTMRTVWIDRGGGRWAVRKRFHPVVRGFLIFLCVCAFGIVYTRYDKIENHHAEAITKSESKHEITVAKLPEPELKPVQDNVILIPLRKKSEIILPSEKDSNTDKIISKPEAVKPRERISVPMNNGKYNILINKSTFTLSLFKGSELVKNYPVAVGRNTGDKQYVGDNRTPVGDFKIVSIENASKWKHDFGDGKGKIAGAYGTWFLRLDAKGWKGIGIHGTHDPDSRGTNATEGCIRLSNEDIDELKQYAYRNMPVIIREQ